MMNRFFDTDVACMSPRDVIEAKTRGEIEAYIGSRGKTRIHAGARNLSLNVSDDYGNRFLVELIQNAHDAHNRDMNNGEIAVVLDPHEGKYGCLYVANRGNGFTKNNLEAITNIALSSKSVNESIGNKGLGFRSVLQICQWPEIYSVQGAGGLGIFDGYCFRFADEDSIESLLDGHADRAMASEILENMPCWYLPVYADDRPGLVSRFATEGFASVVRMPLVSAKAQEAVIAQISDLLALKTPLHLFLDRISRIRIERTPGKSESLERRVIECWSISGEVEVEKIVIGSDEYIVASKEIEPALFRKQLDESLERKDVPEAWGNWQGSARVSIAIRLGKSVERGMLYCFLPLGEAGAAPFAGYINANFYTKMDRRSVNGDNGLNRFFVSVATEVNCYLIRFLIEQNWDESPGAVVDLLCWNSTYAGVMRRCFEETGGSILEQPILPTRTTDGITRWVKSTDAFIWDVPEEACLSPEAVSRDAGAAILSDRLTTLQKQSLRTFFSGMGEGFDPAQSTVANWIESVAQRMLERKVEPERWATLYDEVAQYMRADPKALFGKKFLLSVNNVLIASEPTEGVRRRRISDIYFPPVMAKDADSDDAESKKLLPLEKFPASIKRGFAFLNREVPWLNADGGYRPGREFLLGSKLVRDYETEGVIRTLSGVTQGEVVDRTKEQALEWAFRLWSSGRSLAEKDTRAVSFHVPTHGGWLSAESAMFGSGWAVPNGKRLDAMLKACAAYSDEIAAVRGNFLPRFEEWPIKYGNEEDWTRFLQAAGVRDCLRPVGGESRIQLDNRPFSLAEQLSTAVTNIDSHTATLWRSDLYAAAKKAAYSTVEYRSELHPWRLPGQVELESYPEELRKNYSAQIVRALRDLKKEHYKFRIFRPGNPTSGASPEQWPTPLLSFLKGMAWLPVAQGRGTVRFVAPIEAWHFYTEEDVPPRFMELVVPQVAKDLNEETLDQLRKVFGLRVLNDENDAVHALSAYADRASEVISDPSDVRRFRELFGKVWTQVAPLDRGVELNFIPVMLGGDVQALHLERTTDEGDGPERIAHFVDEENTAKRQLLEDLVQPLFDFGKADVEDTWAWLEVFAPGRFVRMSHENLEVHVDGKRFEEVEEAQLLTDVFGIWIADFIVCVAEYKGGAFFLKSQNNLGKLKRAVLSLRLRTGNHLQISMGGRVRDLPRPLHGAVVLHQNGHSVLIAQLDESKPTLDLLARISEQLALALQQPVLANGLEASFLRLAQLMHGSESENPEDEDIAAVLGTDVHGLEQTRRFARADMSTHIGFAVLLAACLGLESSQERLLKLAKVDELSEDVAFDALQPIADARDISVVLLVEQLGMVSNVRELMQIFELPLIVLNEAIKQVGVDFKPINNEVLHCRQMKAYLSLKKNQIIESIRSSYLDTFEQFGNLEEYVRLRDAVDAIQPNPNWYEKFNDLPDEILDDHVSAWLEVNGVSVSVDVPEMPPLQVSRETNAARLREFWGKFGKILSVWVRQVGAQASKSLHDIWSDPVLKRQDYALLAGQTGWLDFCLLDENAIAKWLESHGAWPSGKLVSTNLSDWGLSNDEIKNGETQAEQNRQAQRMRRLKLIFGGREFSAQVVDYHDLIAAVNDGLKDTEAFANINASVRTLTDIDDTPRGGGGGGGGSSGTRRPSADSSLSDEQKKAIGFVGELSAKEWIKRYHREQDNVELDDDCWVSGYRNIALDTKSGDDKLGYDFTVQLKNKTFYYEVKASTGDSKIFEMGPTEIGAAQRYKADKDNKYRILYVANATDPKRMTISLLPNPFSKVGLKKLRPVGRGSVTYAFEISA